MIAPVIEEIGKELAGKLQWPRLMWMKRLVSPESQDHGDSNAVDF